VFASKSALRKFVSCFELPKQTQNKLHFGLILEEMTQLRSSMVSLEENKGLYDFIHLSGCLH